MPKKKLVCCMLIASMITSSQLLFPIEAKEDRELTTISTRDKYIKILKQIDTYRDELEKQKQIEEQKRIDEKRRLEEERIKKEQESKRVPVTFELSAYCSCSQCSDGWGTHTASGLPVQEGFVALPEDIPFGTKVIIPELGAEYICQDRGGFIEYTDEGYMRVDVYMSSHEACLQFGRFTIDGYLEYK